MEISKEKTIEIAKAEEGFVIKEYEWLKTDEVGNRVENEILYVIEATDEIGASKNEELKRLLEKVAEWSGYSYDKFGKENLNISFDKKGHEVE